MAIRTNLSRSDAQHRARTVSAVEYRVHLDLTSGDETFGSTSTISFEATPGAETFLDVGARQVTSVTLNGQTLADTAVELAASLGRVELTGLEKQNTVVVDMVGEYQHTGVGMHHFRDPVDGRAYLHTQFEPYEAHKVYACFDQPDIKATLALTVDAPDSWELFSNTEPTVRPEELGIDESGPARHWEFATTGRMPVYISALVAGPFAVIKGRAQAIDLGAAARQSLEEHLDADEIFDITSSGFDFFTEYFDMAYVWGKYDQLFVPEFNFGAMENAGCVTFTERFVFRSRVTAALRARRAEVILHEMAHMWFGNLVTMRWWDDLWLNESFATYMSYVALMQATPYTDAWVTFNHDIKTAAYRADQLPSTHPIAADLSDTDAVRQHFDAITYNKGASVLRQLVAWVGEDAFQQGIRSYFKRFAYQNATLNDFLGELEASSGRDLKAWSAQWLQTAGVNTLGLDVSIEGGRYRSAVLTQTAPDQHPTLRSHRVGIGGYAFDDDARLVKVFSQEVDVSGAQTEVEALIGADAVDLLLCNDGDLAYAKIRLDDRSLTAIEAGLHTLDDPLARALCWSAAWEMVRDAQLSAERFTQLVYAHAPYETDVATVTSLLAQARSAIDAYGTPGRQQERRGVLAEFCWNQAASAPSGTDHQLAYMQAFAMAANTEMQLERTTGLLDGSTQLVGLDVDTELRWNLVAALAREGTADAVWRIDDQLAQDDTDMGARRAFAARASLPDVRQKNDMWAQLVDADAMAIETIRAGCAGFMQPTQSALLAGFEVSYFHMIEPTWESRTPEEALWLTEGLFPWMRASTELADRARSVAAQTSRPEVARILNEQADQAERAVAARRFDRTSQIDRGE